MSPSSSCGQTSRTWLSPASISNDASGKYVLITGSVLPPASGMISKQLRMAVVALPPSGVAALVMTNISNSPSLTTVWLLTFTAAHLAPVTPTMSKPSSTCTPSMCASISRMPASMLPLSEKPRLTV